MANVRVDLLPKWKSWPRPTGSTVRQRRGASLNAPRLQMERGTAQDGQGFVKRAMDCAVFVLHPVMTK
ncbi:MAG: hypothetical protein DMF21_09965 [Verrucomicrobia bacterium]|nr:MAG: hypothetical protein DMF09_13175 [Verrucomicrobiota bacterium]PYL80163.1 MAG: hypothetical protein DMF21_09965 [Verrucomicrobiota bacterium]